MFVSSNKLSDIKSYYHQKLESIFSSREINLMVKLLTVKRFNISDLDFMTSSQMLLSESDLLYYNFALKRLLKNEPFQYIIGDVEFYGLELNSDARALIPRPETEELVDWIVKENDNNLSLEIADLCSGSGCVALALKSKFTHSEVVAGELSSGAVELIEENSLKTGLRIIPLKLDVLNPADYNLLDKNSFDIWVSNPPYIPNLERNRMEANVLDFEPGMALFVEDDCPLKFYEAIAIQARLYLKSDGWLYFEIHEDFSLEMTQMLERVGFVNIELRKDLQGKSRMMKAQNVSSQHEQN